MTIMHKNIFPITLQKKIDDALNAYSNYYTFVDINNEIPEKWYKRTHNLIITDKDIQLIDKKKNILIKKYMFSDLYQSIFMIERKIDILAEIRKIRKKSNYNNNV
jgi:hypothetical protein